MQSYQQVKQQFLDKIITLEDLKNEMNTALNALIFEGTGLIHAELLELQEKVLHLREDDPLLLFELEIFEKELQELFNQNPNYLGIGQS